MVIEAGGRRREIDAVAGELFHAQGYAATSVRDIARALDMQGASLYAHVTSKEDLLWSIVDRAATAFEAGADAALAESVGRRRGRPARGLRRGPRRGRHRGPGTGERLRHGVALPVGAAARGDRRPPRRLRGPASGS